jgi:hypothetical protein
VGVRVGTRGGGCCHCLTGSCLWTATVCGGVRGYAGWGLLSVSDRDLSLDLNQISGSFPSVVSGLSSLRCVPCLQCMCVRMATSVVC